MGRLIERVIRRGLAQIERELSGGSHDSEN